MLTGASASRSPSISETKEGDAQVHDVVACSPQRIDALFERPAARGRGRDDAYPDAIRVHSVSIGAGEAPTVGPDHAPLRLSRSEHEIDRAPWERHTLWERGGRSASASEYWPRHVTAARERERTYGVIVQPRLHLHYSLPELVQIIERPRDG